MTPFNGVTVSERDFSNSLNVSYTPTIILFDRSIEKLRIDSMLYRFHFTGLLDYIGERHYERYPDSPFEFISARTESLLSTGKDVSLSE